jgi:hypothetical protein
VLEAKLVICVASKPLWKADSYTNIPSCRERHVVAIGCMKFTRVVDMGTRSETTKHPSTPRSFGRIPSTRAWGR